MKNLAVTLIIFLANATLLLGQDMVILNTGTDYYAGKTKWGSRALYTLDSSKIKVNFALDPNLNQYGQTERKDFRLDDITKEPVEGNLNISMGNTGAGDYVTTAHELYHGLDVSTTSNTEGDTEMGVRMFEAILQDHDSAASGSSSIDEKTLEQARALVNDFVANGWDKQYVSEQKWKDLQNALLSIEKEAVNEQGETVRVKVYPEVAEATLADFDIKTIKGVYEDYLTPTNGDGDYYSDYSYYYDYILYDSYISDNCDCDCNCPGCKCHDGEL